MGRKHKRRYRKYVDLVSTEEERERIKNSILQVFRARQNSPGGGGALLVSRDLDLNPQINQNSQGHSSASVFSQNAQDYTDSQTSTPSSMSDRENSKFGQKKRKKAKHTKSHSKKVKEHPDVNKHIKIAQELRYGLRSKREEEQKLMTRNVNMITHNRLTKRLGLFNQGKKSETVTRVIVESDEIKKKVQNDLKKITQQNCDENEGHSLDVTLKQNSPVVLVVSNPCKRKDVTKNSPKQDTGYRSNGSHFTGTPLSSRQKIMSVQGTTSTVSCKSDIISGSEDLTDILSPTPCYTDIAEFLLSGMRPQTFYPGRDLIKETKEDLQKIMRQSIPQSATPTPTLSGSNLIRRSLMDRYLPIKKKLELENVLMETSDNENQINSVKLNPGAICHNVSLLSQNKSHTTTLNTQGDVAPPQTQEQNWIEGLRKNVKSREMDNKHSNQIIMDAKLLLKSHDDNMISEASQHMKNLTTDSDKSKRFVIETDALEILHQHDLNFQRRQHKEFVPSLVADGWGIFPTGDSSQNTVSSSQSSGYHGSQIATKQQRSQNNSQAVITEYQEYPEYMPQFHEQHYYYDENSHEHMKLPQQMNVNQSQPADILDYLDNRDRHLSYDKGKKYSKIVPIEIDHDSDGSPVWLLPDPTVLKKPTFDTPSPPGDMYRKRPI